MERTNYILMRKMIDDDCQESHKFKNSIDGVMVGVLACSGVDPGMA
jgi:hypothetical protein